MLPSFIKGMEQKRTIGKGKAGMLARPHKCCKVCGLLWDRKFVDPRTDIAIQPDNCGVCDGKLQQGLIAFVCGDMYAFAEAPADGYLNDFKGSMIHVSPNVMEEISKHVKLQKKDAGETPQDDPEKN